MKHLFLAGLAATVMISLSAVAGYNCTNNWINYTNNFGGCTNGWPGGHQEDFQQVIFLSATTNAATNVVGIASLRADDDDQTNSAVVKVTVVGLPATTYNVSVTDFTGTNSYALGTFDVATNSFGGRPADDGQGGWSDCGTNTPAISTNVVTVGRGTFSLPSGLDATNVAYLFIFDTNGIVDFTGDFTSQTNISAMYYCKTVAVIPGSAAQAQGQGTLKLFYKKGRTTSSFLLNATGLPARQSLYLKANGTSSTTTSTSSAGAVKVKTLPHVNLPDLQTVEARDKKGNQVFTLQF